MAALADGQWRSPTQVALTATDGNAGAAAASLRVLLDDGLVEQRLAGRKGRWPLWEYRTRQASS